jgi:integrase
VTVTELEFEQVFRAAGGALQLVMLLARDAGLRRETIWNITAANCNFETRMLSGRTKNNASYLVPMTKRLYERLLFVCSMTNDSKEPLLETFNPRRKKPCYSRMGNWLLEAKKRAGVTMQWGFHDLRRTAARALYERTRDLRKVQRFLSHANVQQSCWYLGASGIDLSPGDLEADHCHPRPEPNPSPDQDPEQNSGAPAGSESNQLRVKRTA